MKGVVTYQSQKYENGVISIRQEAITEEKPLRILINEEPFTVTMRTPGMDRELIFGLLYSEDVISKLTDLTIDISKKEHIDIAEVILPENALKDGYMNARNFLSVSSCGVCGKTDLPEINGNISSDQQIEHRLILNGLEQMRTQQLIFQQTGGSHAASVIDINGNMITLGEDIGRHNAVDKVIGHLLLSEQLKDAHTLLVSGRISYEIVIKCFRAKIPVLAAVSAPSSLAIDYAKELGISLFGFCREDRLTQFA